MNKILRKTQQDYIIISRQFIQTRKKIHWVDLQPFLKLVKPKDKILDVGCGTGRLYRHLQKKNIDYLGIDYVQPFLDEAKKDYPRAEFLKLDISRKKDWQKIKTKYDVILCVAVLHHFPTHQSQAFVLEQMSKRLKKDGVLILTVWNLWRKRFIRLHLKQLPWKLFQGFKSKWLLVPFKISDGRKTVSQVKRFLYAFTRRELKQLLQKTGYKIMREKIDRNLCFACKKMVK